MFQKEYLNRFNGKQKSEVRKKKKMMGKNFGLRKQEYTYIYTSGESDTACRPKAWPVAQYERRS